MSEKLPVLTDEKTVRRILQKHQFHFSKKLGQNFLIDDTVCPRIAQAGIGPSGMVLEIGPGMGTLTQQLALRANRVCAVELDQRLLPILAETVGQFNNLEIIHGDILKTDLHEMIEQKFGNHTVSVCANLPYYITTPILMFLLESNAPIDRITVLVQKEVAEKIAAPPGTRTAGAISFAVQYYGTPEVLFDVPHDAFLPAPEVDSAVLTISVGKRFAEQVHDEAHLFRLVRAGYSQRRKTLLNALSSALGVEKQTLRAALAECGISPQKRMENLQIEEMIALSNSMISHG